MADPNPQHRQQQQPQSHANGEFEGAEDGEGEQFEEGEYSDGGAGGSGEDDDGQPRQTDLPVYVDDGRPDPVDNSAVYAAFGRDTAAGRALFKLYNKNKTSYTPGVVVRTRGPTDPAREAEAKKRAEAAALIKPAYKAPRLKKAEKEREVGRVPQWGGKKNAEAIEQEKERDRHLYKAPSVPLAVLQQRDLAKARLQDAMESANKPKAAAARPKPLPGRGGSASSSSRPPRDPNQVLMDSIINEIEERHTFLDRMRAMGDLSHEATIKAEIASRLRDLKQLKAIMEEDLAATAAPVHAAAAASR